MARAVVDRVEVRAAGVDASAFHGSGARIVGELRCSGCGYGIVSREVVPVCPMCHGAVCEEAPWRPFTREQERR